MPRSKLILMVAQSPEEHRPNTGAPLSSLDITAALVQIRNTKTESTNLLSTEHDMKQEMKHDMKQEISDERRKKSSHQAQDNGHVSSSQATEEAHPFFSSSKQPQRRG